MANKEPKDESQQDPADRERRARQRQVNRQLRVWTPQRIMGWLLMAAGVAVAVVHWLAHMGWRPIPLSMGWQDLAVGYPAAALLAIAAAIVLGQQRRAH